MNSKLCLVLVVFALLAVLATADPGLGILGGLKEMADEVLSTAGVHNQDADDNTVRVVHHHHG